MRCHAAAQHLPSASCTFNAPCIRLLTLAELDPEIPPEQATLLAMVTAPAKYICEAFAAVRADILGDPQQG